MKTYQESLLYVMQRLSITILLTLLFAVSTQAQTSAIAPANESGTDADGVPHAATPLNRSLTPPAFRMPSRNALIESGKSLAREFDRAWRLSGAGSTGRESVVLIFRMCDGTFAGRGQGFTNQYKKFTFSLDPAAIAIVHTHPNGCNPQPSREDERVADYYHLPIFTITGTGMYVYEPGIKKTSKVLDGLDWLDSANCLLSLKSLFDLHASQSGGH
jgi:hypothetical protein